MSNDSASLTARCTALALVMTGACAMFACSPADNNGGACAPSEIHCTSGSQCESAICGASACCVPKQAASCASNADCAVGQVCMSGSCEAFSVPVDAGNNNLMMGGCQQSSDCTSAAAPICLSGSCVECGSSSDCGSAEAPVCLSGSCVECGSSSDCPASTPICNGANQCIEQAGVCSSDVSCAGQPGAPRCDTTSGMCVGCIENDDCTGGQVCLSNDACGPCSVDGDCNSNDTCIAGVCVARVPDAGTGTDAGPGGTDAGTPGTDAGPAVDAGSSGGQDAGTGPLDAGGNASCSSGCSGLTPVCDTTSNQCVQCAQSSDCASGETCYGGLCATSNTCTYDTGCSSGACTAVPAPAGTEWDLHCVDKHAGGALGGAPCLSDGDCLSANCLVSRNSSGTPVDGICIDVCRTGHTTDCATGATCPGKVVFTPLANGDYYWESVCWPAACTNDAACAGTGAGGGNRTCSVTPGDFTDSSNPTVTEWVEACIPTVGVGAGGATCSANSDCASGRCLASGECFGACAVPGDCSGGATCKASALTSEAGGAIKTCAL